MQVFKMAVAKTIAVKGKDNYREKVGDVEVTTPVLSDIAEIVVGAKLNETAMAEAAKSEDDDGLPIYVDDKANWIMNAIVAAIKAGARNKLAAGSIALKSEDQPIPTDWEGFCKQGGRGPSAAFAILREVKDAFQTYVGTLGKTEKTSNLLITLFNNKQALSTQPEEMRAKMAKYVEDFAVTLSEDDLDKFTRPIDAVMATCNEGVASGDDF